MFNYFLFTYICTIANRWRRGGRPATTISRPSHILLVFRPSHIEILVFSILFLFKCLILPDKTIFKESGDVRALRAFSDIPGVECYK